MTIYSCYFDGECDNDCKMGTGVIIYENGQLYTELYKYAGRGSKNKSEYEALLMAMKFITEEIKEEQIDYHSEFIFYGDSKVVINQINGLWKCKNKDLLASLEKINKYKEYLGEDNVSFEYVFREANQEADTLSKLGLGLENYS